MILDTTYSEVLIKEGNTAFKVIGGILMTSLNLTAFAASSIARFTTFGYLGKASANMYKKNVIEGLKNVVQNLCDGLVVPFAFKERYASKGAQEIVEGKILSLKDIVMKSIPEQYNTSNTSNTYDYNKVYDKFEKDKDEKDKDEIEKKRKEEEEEEEEADYASEISETENNKGGKTRNLRKLKSFNKKTIRRHNKKYKLKNKLKSNKRMNKNKKSKRNNK